MGRRLLLINLLILVGIVVLARYVTNAWQNFEDTQNAALHTIGQGRTSGNGPTINVPPPPDTPEAFPNYTVIPEKDLFMPDRKPAPPPDPQVNKTPPPMPKPPSLNGVLDNAGKKQALVTIFEGNNPKGTSRVVNVGDDIQGWTVGEIAETTMKLTWEDQEKLIDMFDATPQQQAAVRQSASAAVTVITIGSAAAPVETNAASDSPADDRAGAGVQVGVAGAQGGVGQRGPGQGQGMRGASGRGNMTGDTMRGGTGQTGTMGFPGSGSGSVPFTSGNRRRTTP